MIIENIIDKYLDEVISYIDCSDKEAKDIKSNLRKTLENLRDKNMNFDPYTDFGKPHLIAKRIKKEYLQENYPYKFEYKSKKELFGLPLVHINKRRGGIAKGIIAIGTISIGIISIGALPIGLISVGGLSIGLVFSIGGIAFGGLFGIGGVAISLLFAIGGFAISLFTALGGFALSNNFAVGGFAKAKEVALGGVANGRIAIFNQSGSGEFLFPTTQYCEEEIIGFIKEIKPNISNFILNTIKIFLY